MYRQNTINVCILKTIKQLRFKNASQYHVPSPEFTVGTTPTNLLGASGLRVFFSRGGVWKRLFVGFIYFRRSKPGNIFVRPKTGLCHDDTLPYATSVIKFLDGDIPV